jgi:arabinogalactan endo-1,4-beta-galactosidase
MQMGNKPNVPATQLFRPSKCVVRDQEIENMRNTPIQAMLFATFLLASVRSFTQEYAVGADVSFLGQAEQQGAIFKDANHPKPGLVILKDHGYNWIRLRLFHTPRPMDSGSNSFSIITTQMAGPIPESNLCQRHGKASRIRNW